MSAPHDWIDITRHDEDFLDRVVTVFPTTAARAAKTLHAVGALEHAFVEQIDAVAAATARHLAVIDNIRVHSGRGFGDRPVVYADAHCTGIGRRLAAPLTCGFFAIAG